MPPKTITVALVGNPNAGKSTLFNALSGLRQHVGNYPGVTVEMKRGQFTFHNQPFELIDLPGTYSLAARSPDEMVAVELLLGRQPGEAPPDVILAIVDASNLDRHLYLATQVCELGKPVVLALNMPDVAAAQGITVDAGKLAQKIGLPVVEIQANRGIGLEILRVALFNAVSGPPANSIPFPELFEKEVEALKASGQNEPPFLLRRLLLDIGGSTEHWFLKQNSSGLKERITNARVRLAEAGSPVSSLEAKLRYGFIRKVTAHAVTQPKVRSKSFSDKLDGILIHRVWGVLIFLLILFVLFWSIFVVADPLMKGIDSVTKWLSGSVESAMAPGPLRSLLSEGVVTGVGGVIKFLPQILILFAFLAVLEDCGYMARAAFLMDRVMSRCGLSGKSFIPLLSSVACAVPGILATRVIENRRDRFATILVAPLMSCSARIPVYMLMIGLFLSKESAFARAAAMFAMYMLGFILAPIVAFLLRKTLLRGERSLFVMELPAYKRPSLKTVLRRVFDAAWMFLRRAGTVILATMILVWALLYFPDSDANGVRYEARIQEHAERKETAEALALKAGWKRQSFLGRMGSAFEPAFRPLGWDWQIGMATLASFPAREVIVGTLSILYEVEESEEDGQAEADLQQALIRGLEKDPARAKYAGPVAFSVMVFFALCCQCASTLAVIRRETRSWRWPIFTFLYMTALAYFGAFAVFQLGKLAVDAWGGP